MGGRGHWAIKEKLQEAQLPYQEAYKKQKGRGLHNLEAMALSWHLDFWGGDTVQLLVGLKSILLKDVHLCKKPK